MFFKLRLKYLDGRNLFINKDKITSISARLYGGDHAITITTPDNIHNLRFKSSEIRDAVLRSIETHLDTVLIDEENIISELKENKRKEKLDNM